MADEPKRGGAPAAKALLAAVGLVAGAFVVRGALQRAGRARAYLPEGVDEKLWLSLGGIEQWVTIRGRNPENPVVLVLHGGPGGAMSVLAPKLFAGWEEDFTVVNWDQRGAGRTFARNGKSGSGELTLGRMVVDGVELAEELKRRLPGAPIILFGISWGSVLGTEMLRARPDLFAAYVASGQVVDMAEGETLSYFGTIDRLRGLRNERGAQQLEALGPPPYPNIKALMKQRRLLLSTLPAERRASRGLIAAMLTAPDAKLSDLVSYRQGLNFSVSKLWGALTGWRLDPYAGRFEAPMLFIQGELDLVTPTALIRQVTPQLDGPAVEYVELEGAGHFAFVTHAETFRRAFVEHIRPLVLAAAKPKRKRAAPAPTARRRSGSSRPSGRLRT